MMPQNFTPLGTLSLTGSTVSQVGTFTNPQSIAAEDVYIVNAGPNIGFVAFGSTTATASLPGTASGDKLNATPIPVNSTTNPLKLKKGNGNAAVAVITSTGANTMYFTAGQGSNVS
jgi:hypothetical protein